LSFLPRLPKKDLRFSFSVGLLAGEVGAASFESFASSVASVVSAAGVSEAGAAAAFSDSAGLEPDSSTGFSS